MADARELLHEKLADVYAYKGTELYAHFVSLLGLIENCYDEDFRTITPENLRHKQGAVQQISVLKNCLIRPESGDLPKL